MPVHFRQLQKGDIDAVVKLQNSNSIIINPALDRADGALSSAFTAEDIAAFNANLAVVVCMDDEGKLLGFNCCSTPEFNKGIALVKAMMSGFDRAQIEGKALALWNCVITGPVCVEKASRGSGVFQGLYAKLWDLLPPQYDLAVALVSTSNKRSLAAHIKIGMVEVDQFAFKDSSYCTLAMKILHSGNKNIALWQ